MSVLWHQCGQTLGPMIWKRHKVSPCFPDGVIESEILGEIHAAHIRLEPGIGVTLTCDTEIGGDPRKSKEHQWALKLLALAESDRGEAGSEPLPKPSPETEIERTTEHTSPSEPNVVEVE